MLFLLHLISLSIFLTKLNASLGLPVFLINCSKPLVSIFSSSSLLLMSESRSFSSTCSLFSFGCFLVSSKFENYNNKKIISFCQLNLSLFSQFLTILASFSKFCSVLLTQIQPVSIGFVQILCLFYSNFMN